MAAPSIGGVALPANLTAAGLYGSGHYHLEKQAEALASDGTLYRRGVQRITWKWNVMGDTEWDWWMTQCAALPSGYELWTDDSRRTTQTFTDGTLLRPRSSTPDEERWANRYNNVVIEIVGLMPLVA